MAATKLTCPECGKTLKPAKPLAAGKKVKCPECANVFAAVDDGAPSEEAITKKAAKTGAKAEAKTKPTAVKKAVKGPDEKPKKKKQEKPPSDDDEDDGPATYGFVEGEAAHEEPAIDHVPDEKVKDLRGPAQALVIKPSNAMICMGAICFFAYLIMAFLILIPILFPVPVPKSDDGSAALGFRDKKKVVVAAHWVGGSAMSSGTEKLTKDDKAVASLFTMFSWDLMDVPGYDWWVVALLILICFLGMIYCATATFGAVRMQTLESRTLGIVASIMMMAPALGIGLFGLLSMVFTNVIGAVMDYDSVLWMSPVWGLASFGTNIGIGVWALTTLMKEEVVAGYEYVSDA